MRKPSVKFEMNKYLKYSTIHINYLLCLRLRATGLERIVFHKSTKPNFQPILTIHFEPQTRAQSFELTKFFF